jgi:nitroreductase
METWDALCARRNVRRFIERPIPPEDLERILEAGRRAPSASNGQPWDFVLTTDRQILEALATTWQGARHVAGAAATVTTVLRLPPDDRHAAMDQFDLGQATMAMAVAAADLGIGSGHAAIGDREAAGRILGVPPGHACAYFLALGYPADRPLAPLLKPTRRPFEDVVHWERW